MPQKPGPTTPQVQFLGSGFRGLGFAQRDLELQQIRHVLPLLEYYSTNQSANQSEHAGLLP